MNLLEEFIYNLSEFMTPLTKTGYDIFVSYFELILISSSILIIMKSYFFIQTIKCYFSLIIKKTSYT